MHVPYRLALAAGFMGGVSLLALPVAAMELPRGYAMQIETGVSDQAGWGRRRHHDNGIDAGDIFAGVLVIGAIAAIASAADKDDDRRREADYRDAGRGPEYPHDPRGELRRDFQSSRGIDNAVSLCVDQIERGEDRVGSVDNAARTSDGWRVSGALDSGGGWSCWIDNDGRIREVDLAGLSGAETGPAGADRQLSDEQYARARAAQGIADPATGPQPAYPGGPLPGEEGYDEAVQLSAAR